MISILFGTLRATVAAILYVILTFGLLGIILGVSVFRCPRLMAWLGLRWNDGNNVILALTMNIQWDIQGLTTIDPKKSFLVMANHQTWADIIVLQKALPSGAPLSRYFIKKQLAHIPI